MTVQWSVTTRNRLRDAYATAFPAAATLEFRTGSPAGVTNSAGGSLLATITLPVTPYTTSNGSLTKNGTWSVAATGAGTIGHYRLTNGADIEEGTITATGGGGDMTVDTVTIAAIGQTIEVTTFTNTIPYA